MTVSADIKSLNEAMIPGSLEMLAREWANCCEASIDEEGDVWIAEPQRGHWLSEDDKLAFAAWTAEQDLDDAQARHDPSWGVAKGIHEPKV